MLQSPRRNPLPLPVADVFHEGKGYSQLWIDKQAGRYLSIIRHLDKYVILFIENPAPPHTMESIATDPAFDLLAWEKGLIPPDTYHP